MGSIVYGKPVPLSERVSRITAGNAGLLTGPGTNTYLVGREQIAVIDPGPADAAHCQAILDAVGDRLRWILVTHTHPDHSPCAKLLADATGAKVMGNPLANDDGFQDDTFVSAHCFAHDELFVTEEFRIRALYTPGHVDNHICYLIEDDGLLLTGDHIMAGSTVVIIPPHGNMKHYIESLQLMRQYPLRALGPGHGEVIETPEAEIDRLIAHRLGREAKVLARMEGRGPLSLDALTELVYDDVSPALHAAARYSLWAHLLKLAQEHQVGEREGQWRRLV